VGIGQRELIIGDRQTGKSSISLDTSLNQFSREVRAVLVFVGQKASSVLASFFAGLAQESCFYLTFILASSSASSVLQFQSVYSGAAICDASSFRASINSVITFDDLSKHAISYREIYLLLRRPPGREAYPGEIFFVHSCLKGPPNSIRPSGEPVRPRTP
jgi:F-type H+-transporting ATPase subunit alpha